jgi:hypothetical protein
MPDSREFDVRQLSNLVLPYDVQTKELTDSGPRIVAGQNTYITPGGKIAQAPGLNNTGLTSFTLPNRVDRLVVYETVEPTPKIYLMASVLVGGFWQVQYLRLDSGSPAWTSVGTLRGVNISQAPHEFVVARGLCFIKGFGLAQKIGAVVFDGSGVSPTLKGWGIDGPNGTISYLGQFGVTASPLTVLFGWRYVYAYVSNTGHVSNRSFVIGNAGFTGPFTNSKPRLQVVYSTDPQVTNINIYRTTDGGGTPYFLAQIANNSAGGTVNYDDNGSVASAGDPKADNELDTRNIAPSETSNYFPPSVLDTSDFGAFILQSTPPEYFARRIWYAMGNRLYYSGQEEILNGVPEESYPSPWGLRGNFYVFQGQVRHVKASKRALYIGTSNEMIVLTGQDKTNFLPDTLVKDIGSPAGHPLAICSFRDSIFFMSSDLQIYSVTGANPPVLISAPLGSSLRTTVNSSNVSVQLETFARDGNTWLIVNVADSATPANNRQFVYDLARNIWFTPWTKKITAMTFGRLRETDQQKHLIVTTWDGTTAKLAVLDTEFVTDAGDAFYPFFTANLVTIPAGNHINELRKWAHAPMLSYFVVEYKTFAPNTDIEVWYRLDEFAGGSTQVSGDAPPFTAQHASYSEKWYAIQQVAKRVQISITLAENQKTEIQNIAFAFQPEAGV